MKIIKLLIVLLTITVTNISVSAQRNCGSMEYLAEQLLNDPGLQQRMSEIETRTNQFFHNQNNGNRATVYTIPVVVHVVYNGSSENISTAQVNSQIQVLNDDFRRLNSDADNTWSQASDIEIEFCLATVDPNGNSTSGITRTSTNVNSFNLSDQVKFNSSGGKDAWPANDYLNLWVCDLTGSYLGYAQFPGGADATDGVVIDYAYIGTMGTATAPFDLGRTATHEVGHWLNLRHIWGDGACGVDDFVSDTPTSDAANYGCATGHNSCGSVDMVQNYMDYSDDACMNLFTTGQKTRMRALFSTGGDKASLLNSNGCGSGSSSSCTDGIQNGNETGIDCGGTECAPCNTGCADNSVNISITFDNYPEETSWQIKNSSGSVVESGGTYANESDGSTLSIDICLTDGCYDFIINDVYGDGICCSYGSGSYSVTSGGTTLANGGSFGSSETTNFCFGSSAPTCTDGLQNGNETDVDCGGPDCDACPTCNDGIQNGNEIDIDCGGSDCPACPTCNDGIQNGNETGIDCGGPDCDACSTGGNTEIFAHYFESGWDGWTDGGSDCYRYNGSRSYEGNRSIRIRDNSGSYSSMTSSSYNVSSYNAVKVEFYFYAYSMENGEDFFLKYHDGNNWNTVGTWARGTSFNNNTFYVATVTIAGGSYNMATNAKFRFQCDASGNNDHIYIDAVTVTGIGSGSKTSNNSTSITEIDGHNVFENSNDRIDNDFDIFPNPVLDILTINGEENINSVKIYSIDGQLIKEIHNDATELSIDVSDITSGLYFISIETEEEISTTKFIKEK